MVGKGFKSLDEFLRITCHKTSLSIDKKRVQIFAIELILRLIFFYSFIIFFINQYLVASYLHGRSDFDTILPQKIKTVEILENHARAV